jgi:trehalose-6-phosphate synthase
MTFGSPSDPSVAPHKLKRLQKATPFHPLDSDDIDGDKIGNGGYFAIPTSAITSNRSKRRSSASERFTIAEDPEWTIEKTDLGNGGLKHAVEAADLAGDTSEKIYVGTLGFGTDHLDDANKVAIEGRLREDHNCLVAFTSTTDFDGHYNHYCKEVC